METSIKPHPSPVAQLTHAYDLIRQSLAPASPGAAAANPTLSFNLDKPPPAGLSSYRARRNGHATYRRDQFTRCNYPRPVVGDSPPPDSVAYDPLAMHRLATVREHIAVLYRYAHDFLVDKAPRSITFEVTLSASQFLNPNWVPP